MKKLLCLLLAALMLLSVVACADADTPATATGETDTAAPATEGGATDADGETSAETENAEDYQCDLPSNLNYNGEPVNILYTIASGRED